MRVEPVSAIDPISSLERWRTVIEEEDAAWRAHRPSAPAREMWSAHETARVREAQRRADELTQSLPLWNPPIHADFFKTAVLASARPDATPPIRTAPCSREMNASGPGSPYRMSAAQAPAYGLDPRVLARCNAVVRLAKVVAFGGVLLAALLAKGFGLW
jgi:hypothetical protein